MGIDVRRRVALLAFLSLPMAGRARAASPRLAAAWEAAQAFRVGMLSRGPAGWQVAAAIDVPTRAHGIVVEPEGTLLAVARRPGDWLLRWSTAGRALAWAWSDPARRLNGHARRRGAWLYTTETELDTGAGVVVVRDASSLAVTAIWPTHGTDPHDLQFAADGTLWVANGGIATRPETGRAKHELDRMDSSLVRLDGGDGRLLGQWRLDDARLSLRHLALRGDQIGIALQAEHDDPARRADAPVLAVFDGRVLRACAAGQPLAGYGGDIVATTEGYCVSVPRAGGLALFSTDGQLCDRIALDEACALASRGRMVLAGGRGAVLTLQSRTHDSSEAPPLRLDNHWQAAFDDRGAP
jgi:uncharacterized protein